MQNYLLPDLLRGSWRQRHLRSQSNRNGEVVLLLPLSLRSRCLRALLVRLAEISSRGGELELTTDYWACTLGAGLRRLQEEVLRFVHQLLDGEEILLDLAAGRRAVFHSEAASPSESEAASHGFGLRAPRVEPVANARQP